MLRIFTILYIIIKLAQTGPMNIDIETYRYEFNTALVKNFTIAYINDGNRKVFNGSMIFAKDITNFDMLVVLKIPRSKTTSLTLVNSTVNGCAYLEQNLGKSITLAPLLVKYMRTVTKNLPSKCPLKKDLEIVISKLFVDSSLLPVYLPETPFNFTVGANHGNEMIYRMFVGGALRMNRRGRG